MSTEYKLCIIWSNNNVRPTLGNAKHSDESLPAPQQKVYQILERNPEDPKLDASEDQNTSNRSLELKLDQEDIEAPNVDPNLGYVSWTRSPSNKLSKKNRKCLKKLNKKQKQKLKIELYPIFRNSRGQTPTPSGGLVQEKENTFI